MKENNYCYYSKVLKKPFDTLDELRKAEDEYNKIHAEEIAKANKRKEDATKVDNAYLEYIKTKQECEELIESKRVEWVKARREFVNTYGSYHMSYTKDNDTETINNKQTNDDKIDINDLSDYILNMFNLFK